MRQDQLAALAVRAASDKRREVGLQVGVPGNEIGQWSGAARRMRLPATRVRDGETPGIRQGLVALFQQREIGAKLGMLLTQDAVESGAMWSVHAGKRIFRGILEVVLLFDYRAKAAREGRLGRVVL